MRKALAQSGRIVVRKPYNQALAEVESIDDLNFSPEIDEIDDFDGELASIERELSATSFDLNDEAYIQ